MFSAFFAAMCLLGMFIAIGFVLAGEHCKSVLSRILMGLLIGVGIVFVIAAVVFVGCANQMGKI